MTLRVVTAILAVIVMATLAIGAYFVFTTTQTLNALSQKVQSAEGQGSEINLQRHCSEDAQRYYHTTLDNASGPAANRIIGTQANHWSTRLNKCFIKATFSSPGDNFLSIDVYDALEGKHYASFNGTMFCAQDRTKCSLNAGDVWLDGDDQRKNSDYHVGFAGIPSGRFGNGDTQQQFLQQIKQFMDD